MYSIPECNDYLPTRVVRILGQEHPHEGSAILKFQYHQ